MLDIWINKSMTTDAKLKLRAFGSAYTFNTQYCGADMLFFFVKIVQPDTRAGLSDINFKLYNMNMS